MDIGLIVKICVALCACAMAIVSLGFETIHPATTTGQSWFKGLTKYGFFGLISAIGVFLFGGINEYLSMQADSRSSAKVIGITNELESTSKKLDSANNKLAEYKETMSNMMKELLRSKNAILLLNKASLGQFSKVASSSLIFKEDMAVDTELTDTEGALIKPIKGDEFRWRITCHGEIPTPSNYADVSWCSSGFGDLIANAEKIPVEGIQGREEFFGTRSTGGNLVYKAPYGSECAPLTKALAGSSCQLKLQVFRPLKSVLLAILDESGLDSYGTGDPLDSSMCQMYELRTGISCKELVNK